uniref:Pectate lyase superfamily protein domain-containing protein n=1 Tax=Acrobeloides nanus TaxID=290746 RepID=A0A914DQB5_9BILA
METSKIVVYFPLLILLCNLPGFLAQVYSVRSFSATGNGQTDDTNAVRAALAAAAKSNGGSVLFDAGYTFLTGPFNVTSNVILDIRGKILGSNQSSAYSVSSPTGDYDPLIGINNANNITITGGGVVDGQGGIWWPCAQSPNTGNPPCNNRHRQVKKNSFYRGLG